MQTKSREIPILFNDAMVRAILDGRKTQTRRPIQPQPAVHDSTSGTDFTVGTHLGPSLDGDEVTPWDRKAWHVYNPDEGANDPVGLCPFGRPGDVLWVRECFTEMVPEHRPSRWAYRADCTDAEGEQIRLEYIRLGYPYRWKPSIHMPREASRISLRVKRVWVERVQEISEKDAQTEGLSTYYGYTISGVPLYSPSENVDPTLHYSRGGVDGTSDTAYVAFEALWNRIYAKRGLGWDANPWVWACEFEVID